MSLDLTQHIQIIKLTIAYTILGAFIFTAIITCLSMVGVVKFARPSQQSKLFATLIVEIVIVSVGAFSNLLKFNPREVQREVERPLIEEATVAKKQATVARTKLQQEVLAGLKPEAAGLALLLQEQAKSKGIELRIVSGYRSPEQQAELFAKRLSGTRISTHNTGLAFDVVVIVDDKATFDGRKYDEVGELGKSIGLVWGGDWSVIRDPPHFETKGAREAMQLLRGA